VDAAVRTIALRVEYDGAPFHGFQRQTPERPSVQGLLEELLGQVLDEPVTVIGAGRTDAGVHAIGQVVHVQTRSDRSLEAVVRMVRRRGHGLVGVRDAWEAPSWFHARHHASRRVYQYHLLVNDSPLPVVGHRAWHVRPPLEAALLRSESGELLGRRDFRAFHVGGVGTGLRHHFRTIHRVEWHAPLPTCDGPSWIGRQPLWMMEIEADAFLPRMVRMIAATLVDVAAGHRPPGTTARVLRSRDPRLSSVPAPAHGLCLVRVEYPAECGVPGG